MSKIVEKCKFCGANLEYEEGTSEVTCEYCNNKTIINNQNSITNNYNPSDSFNNINNNNNLNPVQLNKPKKKKKKNIKKKLLYLFFILIIIASGIIYYLDYQKRTQQPEIFDPLPSEIEIKEEDKAGYTIESTIVKLAPDVDLSAERKKNNNNDIVGRLEIPDLINTLVVKGKDNSYYLTHSIKKQYDIRGTEFLDYRNTTTSKQINIYGHNTRDSRIKVAFLKLEQFLKQDFFDNNKYIVFQHDGGKNFYKIIAIKEVRNSNNEHMGVNYTGDAFVQHVQKMTTGEGTINSRSVYYNQNSEIIVLQTCSHHWDNAYYIITAVKL